MVSISRRTPTPPPGVRETLDECNRPSKLFNHDFFSTNASEHPCLPCLESALHGTLFFGEKSFPVRCLAYNDLSASDLSERNKFSELGPTDPSKQRMNIMGSRLRSTNGCLQCMVLGIFKTQFLMYHVLTIQFQHIPFVIALMQCLRIIGRERRKKCEENRPTCRECHRRQQICVWPDGPRIDRRRRNGYSGSSINTQPIDSSSLAADIDDSLESTVAQEHLDTPGLTGLALAADSLTGDDATFLFQYCFKIFLPCQCHQPYLIGVTDLSYVISMSLNCTFLKDALMACAMLTVQNAADKWQARARAKYLSVVRELSSKICQQTLSGKEDELLDAVVWLCIFEVRYL